MNHSSDCSILIPTRNRIVGLIECLKSIERATKGTYSFEIIIQDNSDAPLPKTILNYFSDKLSIRYYWNETVISMSSNWNLGIKRVLKIGKSKFIVLADRRLLSKNIYQALDFANKVSHDFICFDHQRTWINSFQVTNFNYTRKPHLLSNLYLTSHFYRSECNHTHPMLFNCLLSSNYMQAQMLKYGSYSEGASPDINFLARTVNDNIKEYFYLDLPVIITNARHVALSNGTGISKHESLDSVEHVRLSGHEVFPIYMKDFITANVHGSLFRYQSKSATNSKIDVLGFFKTALQELGFPRHKASFNRMKDQLFEFAYEYSLPSDLYELINNISFLPGSAQTHPICFDDEIWNTPNLSLLDSVEVY